MVCRRKRLAGKIHKYRNPSLHLLHPELVAAIVAKSLVALLPEPKSRYEPARLNIYDAIK